MKRIPLTVRGCPDEVHKALKKSAKANHRSLNGETLHWLEKQCRSERVVTGREAAAILRQFEAATTDKERAQMADAIEDVRKRIARNC